MQRFEQNSHIAVFYSKTSLFGARKSSTSSSFCARLSWLSVVWYPNFFRQKFHELGHPTICVTYLTNGYIGFCTRVNIFDIFSHVIWGGGQKKSPNNVLEIEYIKRKLLELIVTSSFFELRYVPTIFAGRYWCQELLSAYAWTSIENSDIDFRRSSKNCFPKWTAIMCEWCFTYLPICCRICWWYFNSYVNSFTEAILHAR